VKAKGASKKGSSKKKGKGRKKTVTRSSAITVRGKAMAKTAIRAHQGMVRESTKANYRNRKTGRTLSITHIMKRIANPVGNWGNVAILGGGAVLGFVVTDAVDKLVATRAGDAPYPYYAHDAQVRIMLRPDGVRIAAQTAVIAAFFLGSYAAQNSMPKTAYFLAGAAIGSGVRLVSQLVIEMLMPKIFSVTKGTEKNIGNRVYPFHQDALQDAQAKIIEAEDKAPKNLPGQGGTADTLPDSYLYPKAAAAPAAAPPPAAPPAAGVVKGVPPIATRRMAPRVVAGVGVGTPMLEARRPQIMYAAPQGRQPAARPGQYPSQFLGEPVATLGEPVATAAVRTAPIGVGAQGDCPGCGAGLRRDQDVHDGLNVKAVWPRGAAIDVTGDGPMQMPSDRQAAEPMPGPEVFQPGVPGVTHPSDELGTPKAFNRGPQNAAGRPRGVMRKAGASAGLAGTASLDSAGSSTGYASHKSSLRSHMN
jgi:hypothetical protein